MVKLFYETHDPFLHEAYKPLFNKVLAPFNSEDVLKVNSPESIILLLLLSIFVHNYR